MYFKCTNCGKTYATERIEYLCPVCSKDWLPGKQMIGQLELCYTDEDSEKIKDDYTIKDFFPFESKDYLDIPVGNTPFYKSKNLSKKYNLEVFIKNDTVNPTASYKDRASYIVAAQAKHFNIKQIVCASTGNAGSSLAGICASDNLRAKVFIPESAPLGKRAQNIAYGADLTLVNGNYDLAYRESYHYSLKNKCINRNTGYNPYTIEGKKTCSLEIIQQNNMKVPDYVVVPVGDGVIISGIYKGFKDLLDLNIIDKLPKIIGIQSDKSDAIYRYWKSDTYTVLENSDTIADSISVNNPACANLALRAIRESKGFFMLVKDENIKKLQIEFASETGIFCEPASAVSMQFLKEIKELTATTQIVLIITGHGLKDYKSVL